MNIFVRIKKLISIKSLKQIRTYALCSDHMNMFMRREMNAAFITSRSLSILFIYNHSSFPLVKHPTHFILFFVTIALDCGLNGDEFVNQTNVFFRILSPNSFHSQ